MILECLQQLGYKIDEEGGIWFDNEHLGWFEESALLWRGMKKNSFAQNDVLFIVRRYNFPNEQKWK